MFNYNLTSLISRSKHVLQVFAYAASHLLADVKPSCNAQPYAHSTLH